MARISRLKYRDPNQGYYHVISRTAYQSFILRDAEKEYLLKVLKKLSRVYFTKIVTFAIMSNHFHIILKMVPSWEISDEDLRERFELYYNEGKNRWSRRQFEWHNPEKLRDRWSDISNFMQDLKQRFSRWFNNQNGTRGTVWAERFKSVMIEGNQALIACMVYVDLNSVRGGIVKQPEQYRYSGIGHLLAGNRASSWLAIGEAGAVFKRWGSISSASRKEVISHYLKVVYRVGLGTQEGKGHIPSTAVERAEDGEIRIPIEKLSFMVRIRYFTDGLILGSESFCNARYNEFRSFFRSKKERKSHSIARKRKGEPPPELLDLYSMRQLRYQ